MNFSVREEKGILSFADFEYKQLVERFLGIPIHLFILAVIFLCISSTLDNVDCVAKLADLGEARFLTNAHTGVAEVMLSMVGTPVYV